MRRVGPNAAAAIAKPLSRLRRLPSEEGRSLIDVGMAALAARHRETYHFCHANPDEVYLADVGEGVSVALTGLLPHARFTLDCTLGYLILANGMPVGYGGGSALFRQVDTGINLLPEYRGSEAAYLWVQVLRTFRHLCGCELFVINPYQVGHQNTEALATGAFWFYYRLGFRPVEREARALAAAEMKKIRATRGYRTDVTTLKRLVCCDMHLRLPGYRRGTFFAEEWFAACTAGATRFLADQGGGHRRAATRRGASRIAEMLGVRDLGAWSADERRGFERLAAVAGAIEDLGAWPARDKRALARLMKAKGGRLERDYVRRLRGSDRLRRGLARVARRTARDS